MKLKIFAFVDTTCNIAQAIITDNTPGRMLRRNVPILIGTKPGQVPFKDCAFYEVGSIDIESLEVNSIPPRKIDILKEYDFGTETKVDKEEVNPDKLLEDKLDK